MLEANEQLRAMAIVKVEAMIGQLDEKMKSLSTNQRKNDASGNKLCAYCSSTKKSSLPRSSCKVSRTDLTT